MKPGLAEKRTREALIALCDLAAVLSVRLERIELKQDALARILKEMKNGPNA